MQHAKHDRLLRFAGECFHLIQYFGNLCKAAHFQVAACQGVVGVKQVIQRCVLAQAGNHGIEGGNGFGGVAQNAGGVPFVDGELSVQQAMLGRGCFIMPSGGF